MKKNRTEILVNNAHSGDYNMPSDIDGVIRYIVRQNKNPKDDLICWGGLGVTEFDDIETIIRQFKITQKMHTRKGNFGRHIDHEEYSFNHDTEQELYDSHVDIDALARGMAHDFYDLDCCQVLYAVHRPSEANKHLHIHFAINTVNFRNGNKRRETIRQNKERSERFKMMVQKALGEP